MKKISLVLFILAAGFIVMSAQSEDELFGGGDDLFGGNSLIEEPTNSETAIEEILLTNEDVVNMGGSYSMSLSGGASFDPSDLSSGDDLEWSLDPDLSARLYFDARPDSDIRIYGSLDVSYPFTLEEDDSSTSEDESRDFDDIIQVRELFSDFNIDETLFFRAGKQTINWGVGYYYSPADLLNLSEIDPENPDEELEGPLSVKMNLPLDSHNLYLYTIIPDGAEDPADIILAPKAELVLGGMEVGLGAYYRYEQTPAVMATFTTMLGNIDFYGEGTVKYGSDKTFVTEDGGSYSLETYSDTLFFLATLGGAYTWSDDESDLSLTLTGQYYFNGEGYADRSVLTESSGAVFVASSMGAGNLAMSDLTQSSMHYGAAGVTLTPLENLSLSVYWMGNFTDFSGLVNPGIKWSVSDYLSLSLNFPYNYGDQGDEYTPRGDNLSATLKVSLGSTSF